ncbi:hypothetical protein L1049_015805 [Liquidambar formosana]|uniref:Disease resistance protein At1g50180 n=1 Tax=Liquidambar formosana TaxID=63359 RepID=A0AAP0S5A4_LIQFO
MAMSVVSSAVKLLGDLLIQEAKFLYGVRGKVELMRNELELMQSFLQDADRWQDVNESVRNWVSQIREVAYHAKDVIETFALNIESRSRRGGMPDALKRYACVCYEAEEIHKFGSEIETITTRISNLTRSLQTYGIKSRTEGEGSSSVYATQREWRQSYSHVVEEYTVGLDEDVKILVARLLNQDEPCLLVSICGMGGLGKTTLAKKIFHHKDIRRQFHGFAWAYISQQCQRRDVWEGILFELTTPSRKEIKELRDEEVARKLYQVLQEKKCLVILDDIWRSDTWDSLSPAFPTAEVGSKMLFTTRNKEVALYAHKKASQGNHDPDFKISEEMKKFVREMVGKCAGLPLAIIVLGGVLTTKHTLNDWKMVHENIGLHLRGKGHEHHRLEVDKVLTLSYNELPYQLKPCFLHLSQFPEDFEIPTKKLIRMWIAEGMASPMREGEETLEDVADRYLGELLDRCMIQVGARGSTGRVKTCRLHDLMRDLCLSKADEENFVKIIHLEDRNKQVGPIVKLPEYHHFPQNLTKLTLVWSQLEEDPMPTLEKLPYLSILCLRCYAFRGKKMVCSSKGFPQLKSLLLEELYSLEEWCVGEEAMLSLCQLVIKHCDELKMVPDGLRFITTLRELQIEYMPPEDLYKVKHVPSIIFKNY